MLRAGTSGREHRSNDRAPERLVSRGAAKECSLGRKPVEMESKRPSPGRGVRLFRPYGALIADNFGPHAYAWGYTLTPLRGYL
jgi:hypothetical protein